MKRDNKRFIQTATVLLFTSFIFACATTEKVWYKPNSSQQEFYRESNQCDAQSYGAPGMNMYQILLIYNSCMAGKGWYKIDQPIRR